MIPVFFTQSLADRDPELSGSITSEPGRQRDEIELTASGNIVSAAVMEAQGLVMTNKYAEGYPGRRYYGGCQYVDVAENLAIDRARQLFNRGFANVQPVCITQDAGLGRFRRNAGGEAMCHDSVLCGADLAGRKA